MSLGLCGVAVGERRANGVAGIGRVGIGEVGGVAPRDSIVMYVREASERHSRRSTGWVVFAAVRGVWSATGGVMTLGGWGVVEPMEARVAVFSRVPDFFRATEYGGSVGIMWGVVVGCWAEEFFYKWFFSRLENMIVPF
jgi:hypothetical protein